MNLSTMIRGAMGHSKLRSRAKLLANYRWRMRVEYLEDRLLLAQLNSSVVSESHRPLAEPANLARRITVGFVTHVQSIEESQGQAQIQVRLNTGTAGVLTGDVIVELVSLDAGAMEANPFFEFDSVPRLVFPAGTGTSVRTAVLNVWDDDVVRGDLSVDFSLRIIQDGTHGHVGLADPNPIAVTFRGNDSLDVVLNGPAPASPGSQGSLRLLINESQGTRKVQWGSRDNSYGRMWTEVIVPTNLVISVDAANAPTRLVTTFTNAKINYSVDVLLADINRGVVDLTSTGRRLRYLMDAQIQLPCAEPTHTDLEVFARGPGYDESLNVHTQIVGYGYVVDRLFDDPNTGFQAVGLTCRNEAPPVLVTRGTEPDFNELGLDILDDLNVNGVGYDQYTANFAAAAGWLDGIRTVTGLVPSITGHSLGGALAQLIAAKYTNSPATRRIRELVTFNSPGVSTNAADLFRPARVLQGVRHYIASGDIVSMVGERYLAGGYTMVVETYGPLFSITLDQINPVNKHVFPMFASVVGERTRPGIAMTPYNNVNWLSSPFFLYNTPDYYVAIGIASGVLGAIGGVFQHPQFGLLPLVLVFRGTAEASRKIGGLYTTGVRHLIQQINPIYQQFQQTGMFDAKLPNVTLKDPFLGLLELRATNLRVRGSSSGTYRLIINGEGTLDSLLTVRANFVGNNFIGIKDDGVDVVGFLSVDPITLVPPSLLQITNMRLSLNTVQPQPRIDATATVLYGPSLSISFPLFGSFSGRLLRQDITGTLTPSFLRGTGNLSLVGGLASADASLVLNLAHKSLTAQGRFSIFGDTISIDATARGDKSGNLGLQGRGTVRMPNGSPVPRFLRGSLLGSGSGLLNYNHGTGVLCASGWGTLARLTAGFTVCSDFSFAILGTFGRAVPRLPPRPGAESFEEAQFEIPAGSPNAAINYAWEFDSSVPIQVRAPDGTLYDENAIDADPNLEIVSDASGNRNKLLSILNPMPGIWTAIIPDATGLGQVEFEAYAATAVPSVTIDQPALDASGDLIAIDYTAEDPDSDAVVALYYDTDRDGFDGQLIAAGLTETDGPGSYLWGTSSVPSGEYYVYARIEDGVNPPEFGDYSVGRVLVTAAEAPSQVAGVTANWNGGDEVRLTWSPVAGAQFYSVRWTDDAAGEGYGGASATYGPENELVVSGLTPGETYRFQVTATDIELREGMGSEPIVAVVGAQPTIPPASGQWEVFADPGTNFVAIVGLQPGDSATLLVAPTGSLLDATGTFTWLVPLDMNGATDVVARIDRADGSRDIARRFLVSDPNRTGMLEGQVFSDFDSDGSQAGTEPGLNGFMIELVDATTGAVLATTITEDRQPGGVNDPFTDVGIYRFAGLTPGNYRARIVPQVGFEPTEPAAGDAVLASIIGGTTSSVEFGVHDIVSPMVLKAVYTPADAMGTMSRISVTFSEDVGSSLVAADLSIIDAMTMIAIDPSRMMMSYSPATRTATWTFPGLSGGNLAAGTYVVTIRGADVQDESGNLLDGDGNIVPGGDFTFGLKQLAFRRGGIGFSNRKLPGSDTLRADWSTMLDIVFSDSDSSL